MLSATGPSVFITHSDVPTQISSPKTDFGTEGLAAATFNSHGLQKQALAKMNLIVNTGPSRSRQIGQAGWVKAELVECSLCNSRENQMHICYVFEQHWR